MSFLPKCNKGSFVLKQAIVCFPCLHGLQIVSIGFEILGIFAAFVLLSFTILSKLIWPILLCHNQLSSTYPIQHFAPLTSSRMYTLLGVLLAFSTNLPKRCRWFQDQWQSGKYKPCSLQIVSGKEAKFSSWGKGSLIQGIQHFSFWISKS